MSKTAKLLWMDLEMTGLDPVEDRIIEVAVIATDWEFNEVASYEAAVKVDPEFARARMIGEFWDRFAKTREQLLQQNDEQGLPAANVENDLLAFIDAHFDADTPVYLAGNSVWNDRRFIANEWTGLDAKLHYRMLDVSAWKLVFEGKFSKHFTKPDMHRAIDDIRGSIDELKYYLKYTDTR